MIFIVAHFVTAIIYTLIVDSEIWQSGFVLHILQASVYVFISFMSMSFKLKIASFVTAICYFLISVNWLLLERGIEIDAQAYFYNHFGSIITTINLIVIFLLGKDSATHFFNMLFTSNSFFNKCRLHFRNDNNNIIFNLDLLVSGKNIKIKSGSE